MHHLSLAEDTETKSPISVGIHGKVMPSPRQNCIYLTLTVAWDIGYGWVCRLLPL